MATLAELREEAGLNPTELAARSHISYNTLIRMEAGQPITRVYVEAVLAELSKALKRSITLLNVDGLQIK